jgi:hypothetical protein
VHPQAGGLSPAVAPAPAYVVTIVAITIAGEAFWAPLSLSSVRRFNALMSFLQRSSMTKQVGRDLPSHQLLRIVVAVTPVDLANGTNERCCVRHAMFAMNKTIYSIVKIRSNTIEPRIALKVKDDAHCCVFILLIRFNDFDPDVAVRKRAR